MDTGQKLDHMANQIAAFFKPYPTDEAVAGIQEHIVAFWSPAMRRDIAARLDGGVAQLEPNVVAALHAIANGSSPAERETKGPFELGEIGASDAG